MPWLGRRLGGHGSHWLALSGRGRADGTREPSSLRPAVSAYSNTSCRGLGGDRRRARCSRCRGRADWRPAPRMRDAYLAPLERLMKRRSTPGYAHANRCSPTQGTRRGQEQSLLSSYVLLGFIGLVIRNITPLRGRSLLWNSLAISAREVPQGILGDRDPWRGQRAGRAVDHGLPAPGAVTRECHGGDPRRPMRRWRHEQ
jgi:hypothetical protein